VTKGGHPGTRTGKARNDTKGKGMQRWKGGEWEGIGKGKCIFEQTAGGDDISRAIALQLQAAKVCGRLGHGGLSRSGMLIAARITDHVNVITW